MGRRKYFVSPLFSCFSGSSSSDLRSSDNTRDQATSAASVDPGNVDADLNIPNIANIATAAGSIDPENVEADLNIPNIANIATAAGSIGPENVEADLDDLSRYISQYFAFIKGGGRGQRPLQANAARSDWPSDRPGSKCLFKLKDVVLEGFEAVKTIGADAKIIAQTALQGLGASHILATGFLLVGNIMERYEQISKNSDVCLTLLDRMNTLVQYVKDLRKQYVIKEGMKTLIEEAIKLIIEVSLACCTQIDKQKYIQLFSTIAIEKQLGDFQTKLSELYDKIHRQMELEVCSILRKEPPRPQVSEEFIKENGVHIDNVIELLEWESDNNAVAVILYGLGGIGKTTLANAAFNRLCDENKETCKSSYLRLFESIIQANEIEKLQTKILQDLKGSRIPDIRRYEEGRDGIESILVEKEVVFIYIDNVLFPEVGQGLNEVEKLLPRTTEKVKKLRLLITARDKGAAGRAFKKLGIKTKFYPIETLPDTKAMELFKKELKDGETNPVEEQMNGWEERPINQIVQICGGIPGLLMEVAKSIKSERNVEEAQENCKAELILKEIERYVRDKAELIVKAIERYVFAHEYLYKKLKDPFSDICLYFKEWDWEELPKIVGQSELNELEDMALVTKDIESRTAKVHNAILEVGLHYKGGRFKLTSGNEFQEFLEFLEAAEAEDLKKIKGIWASDISGRLGIPASKLDLMRKSLRVLALGNSTEVKGQCKNVFDELYFFSAEISHLPFDPSRLKKLRHLCYNPEDLQKLSQMPSHLSDLRVLRLREAQLTSWTTKWKRLFQVPGNLVNGLRQRGSPYSLPESIGQLNSLDSLELSLTDFRELPDAFCSLSSLTKLEMDNCRRLKELPGRFGEVTRLRKLSLVRCSSLKNLPDSFSQLSHLVDLNLSGCVALEKLCTDFRSLSSLKVLSLKECKELEELPEGFHLLALLKHLDLSDCHKLKGQPMENIVKMEKLEIVEIHRSPLLQEEWRKIKEDCNQWSDKVRSGQGSSN